MTQADQARVREFSQKMRDKGSAGFADGPWDDAESDGNNRLSAKQRQQRNWGMKTFRRTRKRTFSERVLTWVAILALITLVAGIAGAWLSYQPEPEITVTRTDWLNNTPGLAHIESRLTRMEKRLSHILDPYIRRLNNLGNELNNSQEQLVEHIRNTEQQQAITTTGFEERLENAEQQLAATDERMDALSTMLVALGDSKPESVPGPDQAVSWAPPAAGFPGTREAATVPVQDKKAGLKPLPEPEVSASNAGGKPAPAEPETPVLAAAAPAGSQTAAVSEPVARPELAAEQPAATAVVVSQIAAAPEPMPEARPEPAAQQPVTVAPPGNQIAAAPEPVPDARPEPAQQQPVTVAPTATQTAAAHESVQETRPEPAAPVAAEPATVTAQGNWAINIASYTNERIARRELAKMQQKGVDVELVSAEVNGKTIYRARVFGFASRRAATAAATEIQSKLGLKETWITKR
jgi:hypothetical protein